MEEIEPALLDYGDAAKYLATSERHIRRLWEYGQISGVKVGKLTRFRKADLDKYIEDHAVKAARR